MKAPIPEIHTTKAYEPEDEKKKCDKMNEMSIEPYLKYPQRAIHPIHPN
jgi:hypothetical protein